MALSPIQIFSKGNENSLQAILAGGNNVISGIMNQAIQIGRDISNKQLAQERDLLGVRQQETALAQRRVENRQQDYEDAKNFSRSAFESDRRYATDQANTAFNQERTTAQDVFGNRMEWNQGVRSERGLELQEEGLRIRENETKLRNGATQKQLDDAAEQVRLNRQLAESEPENVSSAKAIFDAAENTKDPALINKAGAGVVKFPPPSKGKASGAPFTPDEKASFDFESDRGAYPRHTDLILNRAKGKENEEEEVKALKDTDEYKKAAERDRLGVQAEYLAAAAIPDIEEYANYKGMRLTPAQVEKRRNTWRVAHGKATTPTGAPLSSGAVSSFYQKKGI